MCPGQRASILTIAAFSVTRLLILNEFCLLLFVLTMIISRLKKLNTAEQWQVK